jgi:hypothetical protein
MMYFAVEIKSCYGSGPWTVVNLIKAANGRLAIDMEAKVRCRSQLPNDHYRVRPVGYEDFLHAAHHIAKSYPLGDRLEWLESVSAGCAALISPK